jgi:hypothetical protein
LPKDISEAELIKQLFPERSITTSRKLPDYEYIHKEMAKSGVEKTSWYTPTINKTYHEMAEHYGTAVIPARVRRPKDKPNAEGTVGVISTWIIAALRNQQFFSLRELNDAISEKLANFNNKPFQKKPGSRLSIFLEEEKTALMPLPKTQYELAIWKVATVQFNYHISVDKMNYNFLGLGGA